MVYLANSRQDMLIKQRGKFIDEVSHPITLHMVTNNAYMSKDRKKNDAPNMIISGSVYAISFNADGINPQLVQPSFPFTARYEFDKDELIELVQKGYWDVPTFKCPEIISNNPDYQQPITKIPSKIRRYRLGDEMMIVVELGDIGNVYSTNMVETGYRLSSYCDMQIPQPEVNEEMKFEMPTYATDMDADLEREIAEMFANRNIDSDELQSDEELDKRVAQEKNRQAEISADLYKLALELPSVQMERKKAEMHDETMRKSKAIKHDADSINDSSLPSEEIIHEDFGDDAELAAFVGESMETQKPTIESKPQDNHESVNTELEEPNTPDSVIDELDKLFADFEQSNQQSDTNKASVEEELKSATTIKSNKNLGKLVTPEEGTQKDMNEGYNI